jgi:hypothetical protein
LFLSEALLWGAASPARSEGPQKTQGTPHPAPYSHPLHQMNSFDSDAEAVSRFLSDAAAAASERDQLRRAGSSVADASSRIRSAISKAEKALEKLSGSLRAEGSSSL